MKKIKFQIKLKNQKELIVWSVLLLKFIKCILLFLLTKKYNIKNTPTLYQIGSFY